MGKLTDEDQALNSRCRGFKYTNPKTGKESFILYSDGIKGILTKDQIRTYCQLGIDAEEATQKQKERLGSLADNVCLTKESKSTIAEALGMYGEDVEKILEELKNIPVC